MPDVETANGRAGFTDVLVHWPRPDDWCAGGELESVAAKFQDGRLGP